MGEAAGIIADLTRAFEIANVEMFAIELPESRIVGVSSAILRKWNSPREVFLGRQILKHGTGPLSARFVEGETGDEKRKYVEVTFMPPLGATRAIRFSPQTWTDDSRRYMILIGQHASIEQADEAIQNERRLSLALRSGGYAAWDHDYRTGQTYNSPEM
jgi:hypothetical protein